MASSNFYKRDQEKMYINNFFLKRKSKFKLSKSRVCTRVTMSIINFQLYVLKCCVI